MSGFFGTLNTGYTGVSIHQKMVDVAGNNIANASTDGYTRQRVVAESSFSILRGDHLYGTGVETAAVERIHDEFTWRRFLDASSDKQYWSREERELKRIVDLFPDLQGKTGFLSDLQDYYNAWNALEKNPTSTSMKTVVHEKTKKLVSTIRQIRGSMDSLQLEIHGKIKVTVDRINTIVKNIAEINRQMQTKEFKSQDINIRANELRDKRDKLEKELSTLTDVQIVKTSIKRTGTDPNIADFDDQYELYLNGYILVSGKDAFQLKAEDRHNSQHLVKSSIRQR